MDAVCNRGSRTLLVVALDGAYNNSARFAFVPLIASVLYFALQRNCQNTLVNTIQSICALRKIIYTRVQKQTLEWETAAEREYIKLPLGAKENVPVRGGGSPSPVPEA